MWNDFMSLPRDIEESCVRRKKCLWTSQTPIQQHSCKIHFLCTCIQLQQGCHSMVYTWIDGLGDPLGDGGPEGCKFRQLKQERKSFLIDKLRAAGLLLRVIILQLLTGLSSRLHSPLRSQPVAHVTGNKPAQLRHKGSHVPHSRSPNIPDLDAEAIFPLSTNFLCRECNPFVICTMLPFVIALLDSHP